MSPCRAVGVRQSPFCHSPGTEDWELHECCECVTCGSGVLDDFPFLFVYLLVSFILFDHRVDMQAAQLASEWLLC